MGDSCFTGDTLVAVENSQKRIDEIEIGDKVWAYDVETGETELKAVTKVYVHSVDEILHLYTDEGTIDTTTNHPFYVIGEGWVAAGDLEVGDEVYNLDGTVSVVIGSEVEKLDESVLVYNLEVEELHSYFVGCVPCLVHNKCGGRLGNEETRAQNKNIADTLKNNGYEITGGGGYLPEEYLSGPNKERKGSNYVDVTATKDGKIIRINTVDTYSKGAPTNREQNAANMINAKTPKDANIILIPKGSGLGDLLRILGIK